MEKQKEIPPNAASRSDISRVTKLISDLGLDFHEAVSKAGIGRNTGYTILRGTASVGTVRKLEEWAVKQTTQRGKKPPKSDNDIDLQIEEWTALGRELMALDPGGFNDRLDGLREFIAAQKSQTSAIRKMFRATPED